MVVPLRRRPAAPASTEIYGESGRAPEAADAPEVARATPKAQQVNTSRSTNWIVEHKFELLMALATAVAMAWGLARTALWLDEGATVVATQRTWDGLWTLSDGPETPLLPYYVLLKAYCDVVRMVTPDSVAHLEVLYRLPSVIMAVLAGGFLVSWLRRLVPARLVLASGAMLLLTAGFSRYGQEARPYAAVLFLAVLSTILWTVLITDPRRRWIAAYAVSVAAMVGLNTLSAGLIPVHLIAAAICTGAGQRRAALLRSLASAAAGLLIVSPLVVLSVRSGTGPQYVYPNVTVHDAITVFLRLFTFSDRPLLGAGPILLLAAVGLLRVNSAEFRFVGRLAACWALIPPAALMLVLLARPNLLFERYVLFTVPAWAILAGLGVVTLADLIQDAVRLAFRPSSAVPTAVTGVVALGLIVGTAVDQSATLREIHANGGHGEDIRPALALAVRPEYAKLPIVVSSRFGSVLVAVYARAQVQRLVTQRIQYTENEIWPAGQPAKESELYLEGHNRVILLQRASVTPGCEQEQPLWDARQIESCMPTVLRKVGYRVERTEPAGLGWAFVVLDRAS